MLFAWKYPKKPSLLVLSRDAPTHYEPRIEYTHLSLETTGVNAPSSLLLNISNSLAPGGDTSNPVCHLSFYSPYWIDNRTNMDLILQDHASAEPNPLLLGYKTPLDYSEIVSPGNSQSPPQIQLNSAA